jgi:hypothetical protein
VSITSVAGITPRHVHVVGGEEDAVRCPVSTAKSAVHAGQEEPTEEQLLPEHGVEDLHQDDEAEPAAGATEEALLRRS